MGIAIGFLLPPILVPNVEDMNQLTYHIRVMFYISAGVATLIFVLVAIGKSSARGACLWRICGVSNGLGHELLSHFLF